MTSNLAPLAMLPAPSEAVPPAGFNWTSLRSAPRQDEQLAAGAADVPPGFRGC